MLLSVRGTTGLIIYMQAELPKSITIEATLKRAREENPDGTILVCGTAAMISRGISIVTTVDNVTHPPTLVIMATPLGRSLEEFYQALNRGTGDFLHAVRQVT